MQRIAKNHPIPGQQASINDVPSHQLAKFHGVAEYDQDRYTQAEKMSDAANAFYGDGSRLREVYGQQTESLEQAADKFHASDAAYLGATASNLAGRNQLNLTYAEAKYAARQ